MGNRQDKLVIERMNALLNEQTAQIERQKERIAELEGEGSPEWARPENERVHKLKGTYDRITALENRLSKLEETDALTVKPVFGDTSSSANITYTSSRNLSDRRSDPVESGRYIAYPEYLEMARIAEKMAKLLAACAVEGAYEAVKEYRGIHQPTDKSSQPTGECPMNGSLRRHHRH